LQNTEKCEEEEEEAVANSFQFQELELIFFC
jgi:hypothetical protein